MLYQEEQKTYTGVIPSIPSDIREASRAVLDCPNRETFEERWRYLQEVWKKHAPTQILADKDSYFRFPQNTDYL